MTLLLSHILCLAQHERAIKDSLSHIIPENTGQCWITWLIYLEILLLHFTVVVFSSTQKSMNVTSVQE